MLLTLATELGLTKNTDGQIADDFVITSTGGGHGLNMNISRTGQDSSGQMG